MLDTGGWRSMTSAPRDGSRILVTVRETEQGAAEVDVAYWAQPDRFGGEGWRSVDPHPGSAIGYAEPELKCWMPMPRANVAGAAVSDLPAPWLGEEPEETSGSGI